MFSHFFNVTYPSLTEGDFPVGKLKNVKILHIQFSKEQIFSIIMFTVLKNELFSHLEVQNMLKIHFTSGRSSPIP